MGPRTFSIIDTFTIKGRGTVLIVPPDALGAYPTVGAAIELLRTDGSTFRSKISAVEQFLGAPPRPDRPVGVILDDDPGLVGRGSELRPAP